jgi:hypothetical protein
MTLYVCAENQTALWNALRASPLFENFHPPHAISKEEWFKDAVRRMHDFAPHVDDPTLLRKLNRETISSLVSEMRVACYDNGSLPTTPPARVSLPAIVVFDKDKDTHKTKGAPVFPAAETNADAPLADLDVLLQRQIEERRLDAHAQAPPIFGGERRAPVAGPQLEHDALYARVAILEREVSELRAMVAQTQLLRPSITNDMFARSASEKIPRPTLDADGRIRSTVVKLSEQNGRV